MTKKQTIFRVGKDKENPYVMINKKMLDNEKLSWKAKGLLSYLLSMPDDWEVYISEIQKHSTDGIDSTSSGIKELIDAGYIIRQRHRNEKGHFEGYEYVIHEVSTKSGLSKNGLPKNGLSKNGKSKTTNNDLTNNDLTNNDLTNIKEYSASDDTLLTFIKDIKQAEKEAHIINNKINKDILIEENFERLWNMYPNKKGKGKINSIAKKKDIYKLRDKLEKCIERYIEFVEHQRANGFPKLQYQIGSTFFNSGYVDYLDENYIEGSDCSGKGNEGNEYEGLGWSFEDLQQM